MSIELVMPCNHLVPCHPPLLLPSLFPSIRVFSNELALHIRRPKYWSFSLSISPSNEYSGLISVRIDSFALLEVQGMLKSLLQHCSSKVWSEKKKEKVWSASHIHTVLTTWTLVSKVMSLLSRFVIAYFPRSKHLNFMAAVTICSNFGAQENKVSHCFHCFPIYLPLSDRSGCHVLSFLHAEF